MSFTGEIKPHHNSDLARSGITLEYALECGVYTETFPDRIRYVLNWRKKEVKAPALMFRYRDLITGEFTGYVRAKFDIPIVRNGKTCKYESPRGQPNRLYCPSGTFACLKDTTVSLVVTEGEKKAIKADQDGFACIAIPGVYAWKQKGQEWSLPEFDVIAWKDRIVYICFDSDAATNPQVNGALLRLARHLKPRGAKVRIVALPQELSSSDSGPAKVGLDDYLVTKGAGNFNVLLEATAEFEDSECTVEKVNAGQLDPMPAARKFVGADCSVVDGRQSISRLRFWRGEFWLHSGCKYQPVSTDMVRAQLIQHLDTYASFITGGAVTNIIGAIKAETIVRDAIEMPAWIDGAGPNPPTELIVTPSGLVHIPTFAAGEPGYIIPNTPRFFSPNALDFIFDAAAPEPTRWLQFLNQLWEGDQQSVDTLQEWFGYLLTNDTRLQKILGIIGPRRSGKGTLMRVLRGLAGPDNVVTPTLASLGTQFGLWPLLGKSIAVVTEARMSGRTDSAVVIERLLSISGEDPQTVDRKCLTAVTGKLTARFVILANHLPRLGDSSGALVGRFILLKLRRSCFDREDPDLTDRLLLERPGILLWAIAGWKRLHERGRFIQPDAGQELIGEMEELSSPVRAFVQERCIIDRRAESPRAELYAAWRQWCVERGYKDSDEAAFGRDLRAAVPEIDNGDRRKNGARYRVYVGLRLRHPGEHDTGDTGDTRVNPVAMTRDIQEANRSHSEELNSKGITKQPVSPVSAVSSDAYEEVCEWKV